MREVNERWNVRGPSVMLSRLAAIVVVEWEHERCADCGGEATQPMAPDRANPRGWRTFCHACHGTGRRPLEHGERRILRKLHADSQRPRLRNGRWTRHRQRPELPQRPLRLPGIDGVWREQRRYDRTLDADELDRRAGPLGAPRERNGFAQGDGRL
jgi:hypothetical protein